MGRTPMRKFSQFFFSAFTVATSALAEGNYDRGEELAKSWECVHCHGLSGNERWPNNPDKAAVPMIAGQPTRYLVKSLGEFRKCERIDDSHLKKMSLIAAQLSDQDIEDISAYYSAQKRY